MDILVVSQYYDPDNFRINDITAELVARGHRVRVLTGLPDYATSRVPAAFRWHRRREEIVRGASVHRVPIIARRHGAVFRACNYFSFAITARLYARFGKKPRADVIFVYQTSPVFQAAPALAYRRRLKAPVVLYCCDLWPESLKAGGIGEQSRIFSAVKAYSAKLYQGCDGVCVSSRPFLAYLQEVCGVAPERMHYLPQHAEDLYRGIAGQYEDNGRVDFLFAGNVGKVQNIDCILRAAARLDAALPFCVHIVGDGSELENCRALAAQLGLSDQKVIFHGRHPLEDMPRFYRMADCFLLTLRGGDFIGKTLPAKSQGYLCAGKPILAAVDEAVQEMVRESGCGIAVPPGDDEALARAMEQVLREPQRFRAMGDSGRKFYEQNYTTQVFMEHLLNILQHYAEKGV